jgi:cyclopropane fatty-acyl-phospholipid synthase-like methyltransferase
MQKWIYELLYLVPFVPIKWIFGHHMILEQLVEGGHIAPCRAIDLGCGEGSNAAIFLARSGFDVTGVDFSHTAIKRARNNAQEAGLEITFFEDNLTDLRHVTGTFDLLVDFGALNDMNRENRSSYVENIVPLTRPGTRYLLGAFNKKFEPGEIELRFWEHFRWETLPVEQDPTMSSAGFSYHLMTRR